MTTFTISYRMKAEEDFHAGDGLGKIGAYDVGQQRELVEDVTVPVVRADTVKGLLRDACRRLLRHSHYRTEWKKRFPAVDVDELFQELFEYQSGDSLHVTSLRPHRDQDLQRPLFRIAAQTAVDVKTGKAQDRTLRAVECGCAGLELEGRVRGRIAPERSSEAVAFLTDGLRYIRRLGGQRRRGFGKVRLIGAPEHIRHEPSTGAGPSLDLQHGGPLSLLVTVEAIEPLHITAGPQVANLMPGLNYIPGSVLLGALRHEWRVVYRSLVGDPAPCAGLLSECGAMSVGDLLPLDAATELPATLEDLPHPVPMSWQYPKGNRGDTLSARGVIPLDWERDRPERETPLKRLDRHYAHRGRIVDPILQTQLRNRIEEKSGRVEEAGLFSIETIPAGSRLAGRIGFADVSACRTFLAAFGALFDPSQDCWLGVGRGRKPVRILQVRVCHHAPIDEEAAPNMFVLRFDSDCLFRDRHLGWLTDLGAMFRESFGDAYGVKQRIERVRAVRRFTPVGGLPGFPAYAIAARSSYVFERSQGATEDDLANAWRALRNRQWRGLGEGTSMGYGRFTLETSRPTWGDTAQIVETVRHGAESARERMFEMAEDFAKRCDKNVSTSQWQNLQTLVRDTPASDRREKIQDFLSRATRGGRVWGSLCTTETTEKPPSFTDLGNELMKGIDEYGADFVATVVRYRAVYDEGKARRNG